MERSVSGIQHKNQYYWLFIIRMRLNDYGMIIFILSNYLILFSRLQGWMNDIRGYSAEINFNEYVG